MRVTPEEIQRTVRVVARAAVDARFRPGPALRRGPPAALIKRSNETPTAPAIVRIQLTQQEFTDFEGTSIVFTN